MDKGKFLFIGEDGQKKYELDYVLGILEHNPIQERQLKMYMGLESNPNITGDIPKSIYKQAWQIHLKKHKKVMVYKGVYSDPGSDYWYVDINGKKIAK